MPDYERDKHVFKPDADGDCNLCTHEPANTIHVNAAAEPPDRRSFNGRTRAEGEADAATSKTSEDFRTAFFLAMAEVAVREEFVSTNDAWDVWEARGLSRPASAQAAGTVGRSGAALGLWADAGYTVENLSGNLHSRDNRVRVYRSLIVGHTLDRHESEIRLKAAALNADEADRAAKAREADPFRVAIEAAVTAAEQGATYALGETGAVVPVSVLRDILNREA